MQKSTSIFLFLIDLFYAFKKTSISLIFYKINLDFFLFMETNEILSNSLDVLSFSPFLTTRRYRYITRVQKPSKQPLYTQLMQLSTINKVLQYRCSMDCFSKISSDVILAIRRQYLPRTQLKRNEWINSYLENNVFYVDSVRSTRWHLQGIDVCNSCWMKATTVTFYKLKHCFRSTHLSSGTLRQNGRISTIIAWLSNYFNDTCEKMPTRNEFHLPCFILWKDILNELNRYLVKENRKQITMSYFTKVSIPYLTTLYIYKL